MPENGKTVDNSERSALSDQFVSESMADNAKWGGRPPARDVGAQGEDTENLSSELVRFVSLWARRCAKRGTDKLTH